MTPMHLAIGDSAATKRLLCNAPIRDTCWTLNPNVVTCPVCRQICKAWASASHAEPRQCRVCGEYTDDPLHVQMRRTRLAADAPARSDPSW